MPDIPTTVVPPASPADVRPPQTPSSRVTTPADLDRVGSGKNLGHQATRGVIVVPNRPSRTAART